MNAPQVILCQALDGRWHFGPAALRAAMEGDDYGVYATKEEAAKEAAERGLEIQEAS